MNVTIVKTVEGKWNIYEMDADDLINYEEMIYSGFGDYVDAEAYCRGHGLDIVWG